MKHDTESADARPPSEATPQGAADGADAPDKQAQEPVSDEPSEEAVVRGNTEFAFDLYRQLGKKEGNLFFSPFSVSAALAMTFAGARGETEKQMAQALHFASPPGALHERFAALRAGFAEIQGVELHIANALWPSRSFTFKTDYLNFVEENYNTLLTLLDYENQVEQAREAINQWAGRNTNGKITELVEAGLLDKLTRMVLTNAIYFNGSWKTEFDQKLTKSMPFKIAKKKSVKTPMMHQKRSFNFYEDDELQALELPYAAERISMLAVLPKQADGLEKLEQEINAEKLARWAGGLKPAEVAVYFPKFEAQASFRLEEELKTLGVADAFEGEKADFTGMADPQELKKKGNLYISAVVHKAVTRVDEKGTEAAAATAVVMRTYSTATAKTPEFRADRPFIFVIRDTVTGTLFFVGRVANPQEK